MGKEVPEGFEAEGIPELDEFGVEGMAVEVSDDVVGLLLDEFVYFLEGGDLCIGPGLLVFWVMVLTKCWMKAVL